MDLSDDDAGDCHPNIELASWKRIKAQQRAERRSKEDAEMKRLQEKIEKYEERAKTLEGQPGQMEALEQAEKYREKLEEFMGKRKWVAEDVAHTKEDRSLVNEIATVFPPPSAPKQTIVGPVSPDADFDTYDTYVKRHEDVLRAFVAIENNREASEKYMLEHPDILNQHADGFLLLLCLDVAMKHRAVKSELKTPKQIEKEKREIRRIIRQHLLLNYVLELAKLSKVDDMRAAVRPFFLKTSKNSKEQLAEFEGELEAFVGRIEKRADEKLSKGETSPLAKKETTEQEVEYEPAGLGPGGLDPNEVLTSLPVEMQSAFVDQDIQKLKDLLSSMPVDEANYHLNRCINSGLWVVPQRAQGEPESEEDSEEEEQVADAAAAAPLSSA